MKLTEFLIKLKDLDKNKTELDSLSEKYSIYGGLCRMELENNKPDFNLELIEKNQFEAFFNRTKEVNFFQLTINDLFAGYYEKTATIDKGYIYGRSVDFWENDGLFSQWENISAKKEEYAIVQILKMICRIYKLENDLTYEKSKEFFYSQLQNYDPYDFL
jgi:hypothetical protein